MSFGASCGMNYQLDFSSTSESEESSLLDAQEFVIPTHTYHFTSASAQTCAGISEAGDNFYPSCIG